MGFLLPFQKVEDLKTIDMTMGRMKAGYDQVMKDIVTSSLFNKELNNQILRKPQHEDNKSSEGDQRSKDKGEERKREKDKSTSRSEFSPKILKKSKPEKKTKPNPAAKETDTNRAVCPACGAYLSDKHNPKKDLNTCIWVKTDIKGHNTLWRTVE